MVGAVPSSPFPPSPRGRRRHAYGRGGAAGSGAAVALVAVVAVVAVLAGVAFLAGAGPFGGDDGVDSPISGDDGDVAVDEALPLGEVRAATRPTRNGAGRNGRCPQGAECTEIEVDCPEVADPGVAAVATSPATGETRGVVLLFSGGKGSNWWEDGVQRGSADGAPFVADLQSAGFEVVQVRWPLGFSANPSGEAVGFARLACRSATVVRWVHDNRYQPLGVDPAPGTCGFCVSGNSGGASQSAWSLTHYGLADLVDAAVFTGGPPHAAIATGCLQEGDEAYWYDGSTTQGFDEVYGAARGGQGPCSSHDDDFRDLMEADSVDLGGVDYVYPETRVVFIFGDHDRTVAPTHAEDYVERLQDEGSPMVAVETVPDMGHEVTEFPNGLRALYNAIIATS